MCALQIFPPSLRGLLFHFLTVSFKEWKVLVFLKSNLSIFSFMDHIFGGVSMKSFPDPRFPFFFPKFFEGYDPFSVNFYM